MTRAWALLMLVHLLAAATAAPAAPVCPEISLRDVAPAAGVDFAHDRGARGEKHLPETMGAGAAWLDYDGDGWTDLYLVQSGAYPPDGGERSANRLFRNRADGSFADVSAASGAGHRGYGQGVAAADVDGDGWTDLYLANDGADALLVNRGDGSFEERTAAAGLGLEGWSSSAAFADADGDGDLDLYVTRYVEYDPQAPPFCGDPESGERRYCDPSLFRGATDRFYRNRGDGTFVDATAEAGLGGADGRGLGVVFTDLDGDLRPDIYVANDLNLNLLFRNRGDGTFEDLSLLSGAAVNREGRPEAGMGVAVADVDGDLDPDLAVTNFDVETNTLYRNLGGAVFEDAAATSGFGLPSFNRLAFGLAAADLDQDGDVDFYVANGHIFERPKRENVSFRQPDQIFLGDGRGGFREAGCAPGGATVARGLAVADFDNDGAADLVVQENGGPAVLLRNGWEGGRWLGLRLTGSGRNPEAVGARVLLSSGARPQVRWVTAGDSYQSSSDRRPLFGLGAETGSPELEVHWPSGRVQRLHRPPVDRYLNLIEPGLGRR